MLALIPRPSNPNSLHQGRRWKRIFMVLQRFYMAAGPTSPVFVLGCGRSGTTVLGEIIARHRQVLYLYEPRYIWLKAYQQTDIWTDQAAQRKGRIDLDGSICSTKQNRLVQRMFGLPLSLYRKTILVDKLPEYAFRIPFLLSVFPQARFIHVIRNGCEVARSIEQRDAQSAWYGPDNYKWHELARLAATLSWGKDAVESCKTSYQKGLLEWRLSLEFACEQLQALPSDRWLEIRYEHLLENPLQVCSKIQEFLDGCDDVEMEQFAANVLKRESRKESSHVPSVDDRSIVGDWFKLLGYVG